MPFSAGVKIKGRYNYDHPTRNYGKGSKKPIVYTRDIHSPQTIKFTTIRITT